MSREQHLLAIELLERLGVTYLRLEPDRDGKFRYFGWSTPLMSGNGSPPKSKRGRISLLSRSRRSR